MKGIREPGIVVALRGPRASIRIQPVSEEACAGCGSCGRADAKGARLLEISTGETLEVGDRVLVETAPVGRLSASLLLLLVPLLGLLTGAFAGQALGQKVGLEAETGAILGGLSALTLSYVVVTVADRRIRRRRGGVGPRIIPDPRESAP